MMTSFTQLLGILTLKSPAYSAIKMDENSVWIALRLFIIVAMLATIGQLSSVGAQLQKPDLSNFFDNMALRFEEIGRLHPLLLGTVMGDLADKANEASALITSFQPPLGKDTSLVLRAAGRWLQTPLTLLANWLTVSMIIFLAARLFGGKGSLREHVSLFLLAFLPQALVVFNSFNAINSGFALAGQILLVVAWIWGFLILVAALKSVHDLNVPVVILITMLAFTIFEFLPGSFSLGSVLFNLILRLLF
jgi:hypothetical protein